MKCFIESLTNYSVLETLFVQPFDYKCYKSATIRYLCLHIDHKLIDREKHLLKVNAKFVYASHKIQDFKSKFEKSYDATVRIVITKEYFDEMNFTDELKHKYQFETFTIAGTGETFMLSKEFKE